MAPSGMLTPPFFVGRCHAAARRGYQWAGVAVGGQEDGEKGVGPATEGPRGDGGGGHL